MQNGIVKGECWSDVWAAEDNLLDTTRCCVAIMEIVARQQHPSDHFCALPCLNSKAVSLFLMVCNSHQLVWPGVGVPTRLVEAERLYQFIQQSSYTVVLLRRAGYGFVAHGADAAHLQPLYQTLPVESVLAWQHSQLVFHFEVLQTHSTRLPMKTQLLWIPF